MDIESLKYFHMIAKAGNISTVAQEVHLSQSALSQQVRKLENLLSRDLLSRSNKGVSLTSTGKIVYKYAEYILRTYEEMMQEIREVENQNEVIRIEACQSLADYALPCTIITANQRFPGHHYQLANRPSGEIMTSVANNICDVGFSYEAGQNKNYPDVIVEPAAVNRIVLVAKYDAPMGDTMTARELADSCIITFSDKSDIYEIMMKNFIRLGYSPGKVNCKMKVESIESAKALVARGYGIAFLPYISVKEELYKKQFKLIEVPEFDMEVGVLIMYRREHPSYVRDFLSWFEKQGSKSFC